MAVLPTPGSPMSTGLFLVRRDSTWMTRRISSSRPMTGSSLPCAGGLGEVAAVLLERLVLLLGVLAGDPVAAPHLLQRGEQLLAGRRRAGRPARAGGARWRGTRRASSARASSAGVEHRLEVARRCGPRRRRPWAAWPSASSAALRSGERRDARPSARTGRTTPSSWPSRAASRWSGVTSGLLAVRAASTAALKASWVLQGPAVRVERHATQARTSASKLTTGVSTLVRRPAPPRGWSDSVGWRATAWDSARAAQRRSGAAAIGEHRQHRVGGAGHGRELGASARASASCRSRPSAAIAWPRRSISSSLMVLMRARYGGSVYSTSDNRCPRSIS